jgi:nitrogen-specific signal transduction histidine kinase/CheY-like chemotaxis protein
MKSEKKISLYSTVEKILEQAKSKPDNIERFLSIQRMATIGSLSGRIAHNLNNILGGILGYSQLLQNELDPASDAFRQASVIEQATKRASKLISQFLILSDNPRSQKGPNDPKKLVEHVVSVLKSGFGKNTSIDIHFNHKSKRIWADFSLMSQVLLNVGLNAREAMPSGGVLKLQTGLSSLYDVSKNKYIKNYPANFVVFKISDTGVGINSEIMPLIFDPFFTTKESTMAGGLGLTLAKGIVADHNGEIKVFSKVGEGTTFEIYIPVIREINSAEKEGDMNMEDRTGEGELILVVDDEEDLRAMAKTIFENKGYRVLLAKDGETAIKAYREHADEIRLIILDIVMPGIDGVQIYQEFKAKGSGAKIILTSGYLEDFKIQNVLSQGVESFVPKPWDLPNLLRETRRVLDGF